MPKKKKNTPQKTNVQDSENLAGSSEPQAPENPKPSTSGLLSARDLPPRTQIGISKMYEMLKDEEFIPPIRFGNSTRDFWIEQEIEEFMTYVRRGLTSSEDLKFLVAKIVANRLQRRGAGQ